MLSSNRSSNKSQSSISYSTLHYTHYNPTLSHNRQFNISKRQRSKDSYVEIAKEKNNFVSYEIMQIQKYTQKKKTKTKNLRSQSSSKFNTNKLKNKLISNEKEINTSIKNSKINSNNKIDDVNYEIQNVEITPYSTTLRNYSRIINTERMRNLEKNKEKIINKRNRNYIGSYKISNKIKEMFKSDLKRDNNNDLNNNNKEEKCESVCLGKISIETYSYKEKNNFNDIYEINKLNNSPLNDEQNKNINNNMFILNNKENIINNNNNCIDYSFNNKPVKRKLNYEEEKNNNEIQIPIENKSENKIYQTIQEMKVLLEKTKTTLYQSYVGKHLKQKNIQNINNKNNIKNKNKNIIKSKLIKHSTSCPKVIHSNKSTSVSEIIQTNSFKENINKILNRNNGLYLKNKKYFEEEEKKHKYNYKVIKDNKYNENKLKELLKKIPKHNINQRNKSVIEFKHYKEKTFNMNETKRTNRTKNNCNNLSNIMPPNNLKEIILKKEINFLFN